MSHESLPGSSVIDATPMVTPLFIRPRFDPQVLLPAPVISGSLTGGAHTSTILSVGLLFGYKQKTNTKNALRPFWGSDRVPPTSGGQTVDCCTFVNHMEMYTYAHAYSHTHMHIYIFRPI